MCSRHATTFRILFHLFIKHCMQFSWLPVTFSVPFLLSGSIALVPACKATVRRSNPIHRTSFGPVREGAFTGCHQWSRGFLPNAWCLPSAVEYFLQLVLCELPPPPLFCLFVWPPQSSVHLECTCFLSRHNNGLTLVVNVHVLSGIVAYSWVCIEHITAGQAVGTTPFFQPKRKKMVAAAVLCCC